MATYDVFDDEFKVRRLNELIDRLLRNLNEESEADILSEGLRADGYAYMVQSIAYVAKNLSASLKQELPLRLVEELAILHDDILIRYYELDYRKVWEAAHLKIPLLKASLRSACPEFC
jgi:uncharacterized protein with HEPN domain